MKISVISPVYKAENIVSELTYRISEAIQPLAAEYEIILVEDGSPDKSWEAISAACERNSNVKGIKLSRNFGQHYAVTAGLSKASGDYVVLMDCDLQDNPLYISELLQRAGEGNDIVFTKRKQRKHSLLKSLSSLLYNNLFSFFSERKYDVNAGSLVLFSRKVKDEFLKIEDKDRLYLQILKWLGFANVTIEVEHQPRFEGKSSYNFFKLIRLGVQGWTSHSVKLLKFSIYLGFFLSLITFLIALYIIIGYFLYELQPGWPSIIVTVLFSTGLILLSIGITGIYIGKTFEQAKNRPIFIIDKQINLD